MHCGSTAGVPPGISIDSAAKLNPDSLKIDTCDANHWKYYAKRTFELYFQYYIFPDTGSPIDTLVAHQWQDINTAFPEIRKQMQVIEQKFGHFILWHRFTDSGHLDTSSFILRHWFFDFDQYVNVDSVRSYLNALPIDSNHPGVGFEKGLIIEAGGGGSGVNQDIQQDGHRVIVWPEPCANEVFLEGAEGSTRPEIMDIFGRRMNLPIESLTDSTLRIDLTTMPSGTLLLRFPEQVIKIIVRK